jgi:hypothetical protein
VERDTIVHQRGLAESSSPLRLTSKIDIEFTQSVTLSVNEGNQQLKHHTNNGSFALLTFDSDFSPMKQNNLFT